MSGQPRRSLLLGVLALDGREVAVRLNRVRAGDADPVWVFSRRTVEKVPQLYAQHGPSALEQALPSVLRQQTPLGVRVWELIGIPVLIVLAWLAGWTTHRLFRNAGRHSSSDAARIVLQSLHWPLVAAAVTTVLLVVGLQVFTVSGIQATLVVIGYVAASLLFAVRVIDAILERMVTFDSDQLADPDNSGVRNLATVLSGFRRVLIVVGLLVNVGVVLAQANLFRSLGFSLLASAGALTLILGFAARQVLGNIMASVQIALNRSARIGDQIIWNGEWCTVERIHFTYVQLKMWTGNRLVVPVSQFVSEPFGNWTLADAAMTLTFKLTFAQTADLDALRDRFHALIADEDGVSDKDAAQMIVFAQDAFGPLIRFQAPAHDPSSGWALECRLHEGMLTAAQQIERETGRAMLPQNGLDDMAA